MFSLVLTVTRLVGALARGVRDPNFRGLLYLTLTLLGSGTVFYSTVEGWSVLDALYFSVITLTTVGYGDFSPHTALGKIFTMVYVLVGLGILVALIQAIAAQMLAAQQDRRDTPRSLRRGFGGRTGNAADGPREAREAPAGPKRRLARRTRRKD